MSGESFLSTYETTLMRKDGSRSYVEINAGIVEYEGRPQTSSLFVTSMTGKWHRKRYAGVRSYIDPF